MSRCSSCGNSIDDCNESQPVCPCCGESDDSLSAETFPNQSSLRKL